MKPAGLLWLLAVATWSGGSADVLLQRLGGFPSVVAERSGTDVSSVQPDATVPCPRIPEEPHEFRFTIQIPPRCPRSECDLFVGVDTNQQDPSFLDFVLEGKADGWLAVGFSKTRDMFGSDVLGCTRYSNESVAAVDTWNPYTGRTNILADDQSGICQHSASFNNGTLLCRFSRLIKGVGNEQDFHLNGDFYILFGVGMTPSSSGLSYHRQQTPSLSDYKINPVLVRGPLAGSHIRVILTKTHGILMVVAWPVLAVTAAYFSAFMKPALPNGEWFQVHRAFMLGSLFFGAASFIIIFASNWDGYPRGLINLFTPMPLSHFIIGITVMAVHIANPIIALFRCKPNRRFQWIFKVVHGKAFGYCVILLAVTNMSLGIILISGSVATIPFGLHVSIVAYCIVLFLSSHFVFNLLPSLYKRRSKNEEEHALVPQSPRISVSRKEPEKEEKGRTSSRSAIPKSEKLRPSADSKLRWGGLVILLVLLLPVSFTVCVYIALS